MVWFRFMVFNATVNNISVIWRGSVLLVDETEVPGETTEELSSIDWWNRSTRRNHRGAQFYWLMTPEYQEKPPRSSGLLVDDTGVPGETTEELRSIGWWHRSTRRNHRPVASRWQTYVASEWQKMNFYFRCAQNQLIGKPYFIFISILFGITVGLSVWYYWAEVFHFEQMKFSLKSEILCNFTFCKTLCNIA